MWRNSHVFVTSVNNSLECFTCVTIRADSSHVWQIRSNVKVKWICPKCEKIERICHRCDKYVRILHFCEGLARIFQICNTHDMCDKFIKRIFVMRSYHSYSNPSVSEEMRWQERSKMADGGHVCRRTRILFGTCKTRHWEKHSDQV